MGLVAAGGIIFLHQADGYPEIRSLSMEAQPEEYRNSSFPSPGGSGGDVPLFKELRAIQYEYSIEGGIVVVEWVIEGGSFDAFNVFVDGENVTSPPLAGSERGVSIEILFPGTHEIIVEGIWGEIRTTETVLIDVLFESPVAPLMPLSCIFYGYNDSSLEGYLQVAWRVPGRPQEDPYLEFEILVDDKIFWRAFPPNNVVTFPHMPEGFYTVTLIGITQSYASLPAKITCLAQGLSSPENVQLRVHCEGGVGIGNIRYEIPLAYHYDAVAAWIGDGNRWEFYGYYQSDPSVIRLFDLPEKFVEVEVAGVLFDKELEEPYAISNLPGKPGSHAIARSWVNCEGRIEFRRGDAEPDGQLDLTDAIKILSYMFLGGNAPSCLQTADIDDNDELDITDCVRLLKFLFVGGSPPAPPGPYVCGEDPTPGEFDFCIYSACLKF